MFEMRSYRIIRVVGTKFLTPRPEYLREFRWHEYKADTKPHRYCAAKHPVADSLNRCGAPGQSDDTSVFLPVSTDCQLSQN